MHTREDEIFMLVSGTALVWSGGKEAVELQEGGVVYLPRNVPHGYRITSDRADLLMIATPVVSKACSAWPDGTDPAPGPRASNSRRS
jgi:mannose-6-phosphate isomerase-like protein (cupin superfamily)